MRPMKNSNSLWNARTWLDQRDRANLNDDCKRNYPHGASVQGSIHGTDGLYRSLGQSCRRQSPWLFGGSQARQRAMKKLDCKKILAHAGRGSFAAAYSSSAGGSEDGDESPAGSRWEEGRDRGADESQRKEGLRARRERRKGRGRSGPAEAWFGVQGDKESLQKRKRM